VKVFLSVNNTESHIIFSCESNMQFMCNQQKFFVDGTFEYRQNRILFFTAYNPSFTDQICASSSGRVHKHTWRGYSLINISIVLCDTNLFQFSSFVYLVDINNYYTKFRLKN
jgi:hypothetical protein